VITQPRAVFRFDGGIQVDVHLVRDLAHIATSPIAMLATTAKLSRIV
jgi:hypothetical protein